MGIAADRFQELYDEHWPLVFAICRSRLGSHDAATDLVQEIFVRKWLARDRYDPQRASFRTWLVRNSVNACITELRKRTSHPAELPIEEDHHPLAPAIDAAAVRHALVSRCLAQLDPDERQLVLMQCVEEYTWEEIAHLTGLTVSQARTRTARARQQLRDLLAAQGIDAGS